MRYPAQVVASVRVAPGDGRAEILLEPGFTAQELAAVRALPGRRWDPKRRVWTVPDGQGAIAALTEALGKERVRVIAASMEALGKEPGRVDAASMEALGTERVRVDAASMEALGKERVPVEAASMEALGKEPGRVDAASMEALGTERVRVDAASMEALGKERVPVDAAGMGRAGSLPQPDVLDQVRHALVIRGYSPRTCKVYLGHLRRFLTWCGRGRPELPDDPVAKGQAYLLELVERRSVSRSYQNQVVSTLRFLCESVLHTPAFATELPRPRRERQLPVVLGPREVERMLARARNPKHRALLMLLYSAGLRVGEVVRLRPEDLDVERGLVRVRRGKGARDRYTLLARRAVEAVALYRGAYSPERWLFPGARPDRPLTTRSVQRVVKHAARAAGISKNVTAHTLRHSFATHLLEGGTNLRIIQELLGHQSARTTQIYTHIAQSTLESIRSPLDNLAEPGIALCDPDRG